MPTQTMLQESLQVLSTLVPFDSAWWGEVSDFVGDAAPQNWLHGSIGLAQSFAQESPSPKGRYSSGIPSRR